MRLILEKIGIIENADVEINGLTVIAGNNDSGKSTVGKIAYSLTKSFEDAEKNYENDKSEQIDINFKKLYIAFRENIDFKKFPELLNFLEEFIKYRRTDNKKSFELLVNSRNLLEEIDINETEKVKILNIYEKIYSLFLETESKRSKIIKSIKRVFSSEFSNQITNVSANQGRIIVYEGENQIIDITIKENKISLDENSKIDVIFPFDSSVFIETPLVLSYKRDLESSYIYHVRDLLYKLMKPILSKEKTKLNISKIVGGEIYFDDEKVQFLFRKNVDNKEAIFHILNSASGIKSFGILQILEKAGEFNKNLLLIIDEPEVHLHPDWQVEYAKILIKLVENGVKVLVTSHSPYLMVAIDEYSRKSEIKKNVKFYLSELTDNGNALIVDKTNDKNEIYAKLSKPFEKLIFGK